MTSESYSVTAITSRPLYVPQLAQTMCGGRIWRHWGQATRVGSVMAWCDRRVARRCFEVRCLGTGMVKISVLTRPGGQERLEYSENQRLA